MSVCNHRSIILVPEMNQSARKCQGRIFKLFKTSTVFTLTTLNTPHMSSKFELEKKHEEEIRSASTMNRPQLSVMP